MDHTEWITGRNEILGTAGIGLIVLGAIVMVFAMIYIYIPSPFLASQDTHIQWLGEHAYEFCWFGLWLFSLGFLLKWFTEDSQRKLEASNRFVDYDELKANQIRR